MHRICKLALVAVIAITAVAAPARADGTPPANPPATTTVVVNAPPGTTVVVTTPAAFSRFAWGGIGLYGARYSACGGGFCASATDTAFGINVGAEVPVVPLMAGLNFDVWGNIAAAFGSGNYFPINVGAGVSYDKLPVELFGGLGFSVVPNSGSTAFGVDIFLMAAYPLPQVVKGFGLQGQLQFDILNQNLFIWSLTVGAAYAF